MHSHTTLDLWLVICYVAAACTDLTYKKVQKFATTVCPLLSFHSVILSCHCCLFLSCLSRSTSPCHPLHPQCVLNHTAAWVRICEAHWKGIIETTVSCGVQDNGIPVVGSLGCKVVIWQLSEGHKSIQMVILLC